MVALRSVLEELRAEGLLRGEEADIQAVMAAQSPSSPWYLRLLVGLSAWLATCLLLVFVALAGVVTSEQSALVVGVVLQPLAVLLVRQNRGEFAAQMALALSLTAQVLLVAGTALLLESSVFGAVTGLALALILVTLWPDFLGRLLAVLLGVGALLALIAHWQAWWLLHPFTWALAGAAAWLWLGRRLGTVGLPLAYGLALGLLGLLLPSLWPDLPWPRPWLTSLGLGPVLLGTAWALDLPRRVWLPVLVGGGLFWLAVLPAPGLVAAALVVVLGFGRGERALTGVALAFGVLFLGGWYYQLDWTLLAKAGVLVVAGTVLLGVRWWWLGGRLPRSPAAALNPRPAGPWRSGLLVLNLLLVLGSVNYLILGAERTLSRGESLLLELAPVDPRSLIQGDYMVLDYALAREAAELIPDPVADGRLVVRPDENNVARLVGVQDDDRPPDPGERLLQFRKRGQRLRVGPDAFFFQEGRAAEFQAARYGEFRVTAAGRALLVGLRDAEHHLLGQPR